MPKVTAIIPTLCSSERKYQLERAITSLHAASTGPLVIVIVVNGQRYDELLLRELKRRNDLVVEQIGTGSAPLAQLHGRRQVQTEYFCFLDDDDEYLPGAIDLRLAALEMNPRASVVVTNGFISEGDRTPEVLCYRDLKSVSEDPLKQLFNENWLSSCGALFRTEGVSERIFEDYADFIEWTWLAFRLACAGNEVLAIDQPTFRINRTSNSASASERYMRFHVTLYKRMLEMTDRNDIRRILSRRLAQAWHEISRHSLGKGDRSAAWDAHLRSISNPYGLKFLTYTRHLIAPRGSQSHE